MNKTIVVLPVVAALFTTASACTFQTNRKCFDSIWEAVDAAPSGGTIRVNSDYTVWGEVDLWKSVAFVGAGGRTPTLTANIDGSRPGDTIFRATTSGITVTLENIRFANAGGYGSVLRTRGLGTGYFPTTDYLGTVNLVVRRCSFRDFNTGARGGSVFFVGTTKNVDISSSVFVNNVVNFDTEMYEGGGAIWIENAGGSVKVTDSRFENNQHQFGHGCGGAIGINKITSGSLQLWNNKFINNRANGGGALWVGNVSAGVSIDIHSEFVRNKAQNFGWDSGARGGAAWIAQNRGTITIKGYFDSNECEGDRGGVFANNRNYGTINLGGYYSNNKSGKGASVWDTHFRSAGTFNDIAKYGSGNSQPTIRYDANRSYNGP